MASFTFNLSFQEHHSGVVEEWLKTVEGKYNSITYKSHADNLNIQQAHNMALMQWRKIRTDYQVTLYSFRLWPDELIMLKGAIYRPKV